jgi:hypothetical protein
MDAFQLTVLSIFVVLAILILVTFSIMLSSKKDDDSEYPSSYANCPDYWTMTNGNCVVPSTINKGNYTGADAYTTISKTPGYQATQPEVKDADGKITTPYVPENINFKAPGWDDNKEIDIIKGLKGRCALKAWANKYNVKWDGVNNYNSKFC